jgi:hypothetical protein
MIAFALTKISFDDVTHQINTTNYLATNNEQLSLEDFMQAMKERFKRDRRERQKNVIGGSDERNT